MGLDMYLTRRTYIKQWEHKGDDNYEISVFKKSGTTIKPKRISYIIEEIGYWRKFNALHQWFVNNCQEGVDDCKEYYVTKENLEQLLNLLLQIQENNSKAEDLLPSQSGFFFGSTEYDEWYFNDVNETIILLQDLLKEDNSEGDFYYQSSW